MTPSERLDRLANDEDPHLIAKLKSGYAVMGEFQFLPGYSLLLAHPMVGQLNDLEGSARTQFLEDMARLGDAVKSATGCKRINYSIYGNLDPFLHAHVWPRYEWEEASLSTLPAFSWPLENRSAPEDEFNLDKHGGMLREIRERLEPVP